MLAAAKVRIENAAGTSCRRNQVLGDPADKRRADGRCDSMQDQRIKKMSKLGRSIMIFMYFKFRSTLESPNNSESVDSK